MKKHTKLSFFGLTIAAMLLAGCGENVPVDNPSGDNNPEDKIVVNTETVDVSLPAKFTDKITEIKLNKKVVPMFCNDSTDATKKFNEETTFVAKTYPASNVERKLVWKSSDPTVASVDENGKVTAIGEGKAVITVSNEDGTVKDSARVVVNNTKDQRLASCNSRLKDILNAQKSDSFVFPEVMGSHKYREHVVTKNGVPVNSDSSYEGIVVSEVNAYLDLQVESTEIRVENGSPLPEKLRYTFYTTDQYETFLFKSKGKVKNYMSINQSSFLGKDKIEALKAVCDEFFVSGSGILTGVKEDILSSVDTSYLSGDPLNTHWARMDSEAGQLAFDLTESYNNQTATQETEENQGIPAESKYNVSYTLRFMFENNLLSAETIDQTYSYMIGEDRYESKYLINFWYTTDEEMVIPNKNNYQKVDDAFDL